jgi:hypothetical protein
MAAIAYMITGYKGSIYDCAVPIIHSKNLKL